MSLLTMLELNASNFVGIVKEIRRLNTVLETQQDMGDSTEVEPFVRDQIEASVAAFIDAIMDFGARSAWMAAGRLQELLQNRSAPFTVGELRKHLPDIESRFHDELAFTKLFVISNEKAGLFNGAEPLLGAHTSDYYPSVLFDCDEAARCLGLGRPTACVFHSMRMIEIALGALSRRLKIPDPSKATDRSWGNILKEVKGAIDRHYPPKGRLPHSQGAFLEGIYTSLDAIKNPWRNATMHVESVYTEEEARHILNCTIALVQTMAKGFDEAGEPGDSLIPGFDEFLQNGTESSLTGGGA